MDDDPVLGLVKDFQAGTDREESFRQIYLRFFPQVRRYFQRTGFSDEESRDLAQETFYRMFTTLDAFLGKSRFERWLWQVASHVRLNELRRLHSEKRDALELSLDSVEGKGRASLNIPADEKDPLEAAIRREQSQALESALGKLPEQMRMCCMLRYQRGLKYTEIATLMRISIETVKAHLHQARRRLMSELDGAKNLDRQ